MRKFDLSLRSSRSSYFATFRHQLTILSKTDALDEEKWLNMLGTFVKDWFRYESHFVHGRDSLVDILKERGLLSESDAVQPLIGKKSSQRMEQLTKNQAVATSQEAVQNQNEPQLRDENAHNDKSVHGVLNPTYQAGLRRDAVQPDIEAERKKRDEIEAGKSYCSRRFGGATCDDKSAQIYARFDKNDWRIQPAEFYRF